MILAKSAIIFVKSLKYLFVVKEKDCVLAVSSYFKYRLNI